MRILMIIGQFYPVIGGAERQCVKLSKALQGRGHTVKVFTIWNPRTVPCVETVEGIPVERVWYPIVNAFGYRVGLGFLAPLCMWWRLRKEAHSYDVVHVHQGLWPLFSAVMAGGSAGKPVICKIGNSGERFDLDVLRKTHIYGRLAVWCVKRKTSRFVWTSKAVLDDLIKEKIAEPQLVYIPNGVELPDIRRLDLRKTGDPISPNVRFIFTGTFTFKKNLPTLLNAVSLLSSPYRSKMKLVLLGDGPDRAALIEAAKQYRIEDIIEAPGALDDVGQNLLKSDIFVLPSSTEGLSNSALEAMAYGLPVILSNRGGNRDLVDGNGILIDPDDVESITKAMQAMIDNPEKRREMGRRSRQIAEERYTMSKVVQQYEELYENCSSSNLFG